MSIRVRLTIWYTLVLGAALVIFGVGLYTLLDRIMNGQVEDEVRARAGQITSFIQSRADPMRLLVSRQVELPSVDIFSTADVFVQILDSSGEVVVRSANLGQRLMPLRQDSFDANLRGEDLVYTLAAGDASLRIYSAPLIIDDPLSGSVVIGAVQVGKSLTGVESALQAIRYTLVLGIAITLILMAGVGAIMARASLRPVDRITQTALQITRAEDLSQRLPPIEAQDEIGRLTDTFNEMLGRLEKLFQQQQRLVADVSHELRTPLTTLRGNIDLFKRGYRSLSKEDLDDMLATMEGETMRMSRLVSDLLLLSKADAGVQLDRQIVELDTVLLDVYRQGSLMAEGVKVTLGHEDRAAVLGDRDRLHQLLLNLTDNAIKYTPAGGEVCLSLYNREGWVQVSVSDTGVGIAKEELPHIFERFYRSDRARQSERGGAGLGLSIAKWIAEAHGGHLTVESAPGTGSTFTLWLRPAEGQVIL